MSFKVLSTSPSFGFFSNKPVERLKNEGCTVEFLPQGKPVSEDLIREHIADADALIVGPLFVLPNVITTPHMGAYTIEAMERVGMVTAENIRKVMREESPDFIVN